MSMPIRNTDWLASYQTIELMYLREILHFSYQFMTNRMLGQVQSKQSLNLTLTELVSLFIIQIHLQVSATEA